jgi:phage terminase large subunit
VSDVLKQELDNIVQIDIDKDGPIKLIKKEELKKKIGRSPDEADSLMMRMWFELSGVTEINDIFI